MQRALPNDPLGSELKLKVRAIVFDCDGTLVDSEGLANRVLVDYLAELGHEISVKTAIGAYRGMKMADCLADIERRLGCKLPAHSFLPFAPA